MINRIYLKSLKKEELLTFLNDVIKHCSDFDLAVLMLLVSVKDLKSILRELEAVFKIEQGSELTKEVELIDLERDRALTGITTVCNGYTYSDIPEMAKAATLIAKSIARYDGSITKMNYVAETSVISDLGKLWTSEQKYVDALKKLSLTNWAKKLIAINEKFNNKQIERDQETGGDKGKSFTELRPRAYEAYKELCNHIFAFSITNKEQKEQYESLASNINALIERYNNIIEKRASASEKEAEV